MISKSQKFWDKQAHNYDYSERQFEPVFKEVIAKTKLHIDTQDDVLDFGCATGTKTFQLADAARHIHGLDISQEMVNEAIQKKKELSIVNCSFSQGSIFTNDLPKSSFDKIISYGVIHLLEDSEMVIQKIYDLLKPGGLFISSTACLTNKMALKNKLEFFAYRLIKKLGIFPLHLNMYTTNEVEELIRKHNFAIVETETIFHGITISYVVAKKVV